MAGVRIADGFSNIHIRRRVVGLKVFDFTPHLQQVLQIGAAARVTAVLDTVKQMAPNPVSNVPADTTPTLSPKLRRSPRRSVIKFASA
jgi:hypothetical protein